MEEEKMPHFFKVLVGDFARRLEIPPKFLKHIPKEARKNSDTSEAASAEVTLENPNGRTWIVKLEETVDGMFLTTGWPKFVEDHSLKEYEFLVFRYDGNMHFMVLVFDMTACERATQVKSSRAGARAIEGWPRKLPFDMNEASGNKLRETSKNDNPTLNQLQIQIPNQCEIGMVQLQKSTSRDGCIFSEGSLDLHEAGGSKEGLEADSSLKGPLEDEKTKAIVQVMRRLRVDKVTIDLFCAMLSLYKWNVDAAAQDLGVCRGKQQKRNPEGLKQKFVLQLAFVKRQLRHFFPPDDDSPAPKPPEMATKRKSTREKEPNLSDQQQEHDSTSVKRRRGDERELCDLSHGEERGTGELQPDSPQTPRTALVRLAYALPVRSPGLRRSPRLACLHTAQDSPKNMVLEERAEAVGEED